MSKDDLISKWAAEMGRRGGQKRVPKGAAMLSETELKAQGSRGGMIRWTRVHAEKKRADKRYIVPEKYREAVAALLKKVK